jgi:hypothetical protein
MKNLQLTLKMQHCLQQQLNQCFVHLCLDYHFAIEEEAFIFSEQLKEIEALVIFASYD